MDSIKHFDNDGNEIICEPVNVDELEFIAEIGGDFFEFTVHIDFYSEKLDKDEITALLEHAPTKAWNPHEKRRASERSKGFISTNWGRWMLSSERDSTEVNIKIKELLAKLTDDLGRWQILTSKYDAKISLAGYMSNWNREFSLEPDIIKLLANRNLSIHFDIYYEESDDQDEARHEVELN